MAADLRRFCWRVAAAALMVAVWTLALLVEAGVILTLVAVAVLAPARPVSADPDSLARFRGGIGVNGVSGAGGTVSSAEIVTRNIVRGVQPSGTAWVVGGLTVDITRDGHITAEGRGLIFSAGNTTGTALTLTPTGQPATLDVFATLICETAAPFVERNTGPVHLSAAGDFRIDDVLSPRPPADCATPMLLIRSAQGGSWFAAGIRQFDEK